MAESNHHSQGGFTETFTEQHGTSYMNITTTSQQQSSSTPLHGLFRTASGRETYFPDGHQSTHHRHEEHSVLSGGFSAPDGLFTTYHRSTENTPRDRGTTSDGFFAATDRGASSESNDSYLQQGGEQHLEPVEKAVTPTSSNSSLTQNASSSHSDGKKGSPVAGSEVATAGHDKHPLERRATRSEIDNDERRELQRALTTMTISRKSTRRPSIAEKDDPAVDPGSDQFDLTKFLRTFRHYLEGEGIEMKQLSVVYKDLNVYGSGAALQLQKTVSDMLLAPIRPQEFFSFGKKDRKQILHRFDGIIKSGELCVVLGRPGSGCSTLLKALTGELHGLDIDDSVIHYNGIPQQKIIKEFKGETVYNQEVDKHFPHLTVGQTLEFAAAVRTPSHRPGDMSREDFSKFMARVVMAVLGLSHTYDTKVGNDFVRGVSGGERKRVSVAEMLLAGAPLAAWDNSTRGLDSATALKFVKALRVGSDMTGGAAAVAIYQASQSVYDCFDKAAVLYEGRQIYFGPASRAREFFERQGWYCPPRQTTGDFLTAVTNPDERQAAKGYENKVPRTPEDFENYWRNSPEYQHLQKEIREFEGENPINEHSTLTQFREKKNYIQAKHSRPKSPYLISIPMQIKLNTKRAYQRIWGDAASTVTQMGLNLIISLIVGSIYYGHSKGTSSFQGRGALLFLAVLFNGNYNVNLLHQFTDTLSSIDFNW
jgi:ATP-binding cassette subfamily G (WHITE) protein 2 (PDR)